MDSISVHQAMLTVSSSGDPRWLGQSAELPEKLRTSIEPICRGFGARPAELQEALFAQPLDREWIVVGRAVGLGGDEQHPLVGREEDLVGAVEVLLSLHDDLGGFAALDGHRVGVGDHRVRGLCAERRRRKRDEPGQGNQGP